MENNLFAAFSFSGGASPAGAARLLSTAVGRKKQRVVSTMATQPRGSLASHIEVESRIERGNVKREHLTEGLGVSTSDLREDGGNARYTPGSQISAPRYETLVKAEMTEAVKEEDEEPREPPPVISTIQVKEENWDKEESQGVRDVRVKKEYHGAVEDLSVVNKKRRVFSNSGTKVELSEEIEDFGGGGGLSCRSADVDVLEKDRKAIVRRQNAKVTKGLRCGSAEVRPPPDNWEEAIQSIRTMRTSRDAPVDLLGPAQLVDTKADSETQKFHVLVAAMISSQTRDGVTAAAMKRLHALPGGLTVKHLLESDISTEKLEEILKPVGFYRQKAKQLKRMVEILVKPPYHGCVPRTLDELIKLPGVGPKVGLLVLWVGFGMGEVGLIVDTHVRRICCRLGWAPEDSSAEQVRHELESWLPRDLWAEASFLLVGFGQQICKPIGPNCKECLLQGSCPSAFNRITKVGSKKM